MSTLKILSLNCRGLNNSLKRRMFFKNFLEFNICSLQETYITNRTAQTWKNEWKGDFIHCNGTSNSNGLIILINTNFSYTNLKEITVNGRCLGISFTHNDKDFVVFNMYAPSLKEERVGFLRDLPDLSQFYLPHSCVILNGDFNMLLSNEENIAGLNHSEKEVTIFNEFIDKYDLSDTWKLRNPDKKEYSWIRFINLTNQPTKYTARRLDYLFCNHNLNKLLCFSEMKHFSSTDHKAVISHFRLDDFPRGKNVWCFNDSLLDDTDFILCMSQFIKDKYNSLKEEEEYSNNVIWDLLKISIREKSMAFSRKKRLEDSLSNELIDKISCLSSLLSDDPSNFQLINELCKTTKQKEIKDLSTSRGALKRSRAKFISEDETNSAYFLGLERYKQEHQVIKCIYNDKGEIIATPNKILPVISHFYEHLMNDADEANININKTNVLNDFLNNVSHPSLDETDKELLDAPITVSELEEALKFLNTNSAPGCDGLTPLFYKYFSETLRLPFYNNIIESTETELLSLSQRRSLITLLPKSEDKEQLRNISNHRPISLTTTDYKIYSKVLATRLQNVIHKLINDDQVGYIKGRNINDHIRFIDDLINFSKITNKSGLLVSLDYRKAFDTVCKKSIIASLKKFNFGPVFIKYVATIINGSEASIKNAGWISKWFPTTKGVRQGCNLSPLLFILVVELLAIKIRSNPNIKSILQETEIYNNETKFSQYADDLSLYLKDIDSLKATLNEIDLFTNFSGLALNRKKSIAMWLGKDRGNAPGEDTLKWLDQHEMIKILGVYFNATTESSLIDKNWDTKTAEITKIISNWSKRHCSIWGKSIVAKTFLLSKLNYILQSLNLPDTTLKIIDNLIFKFLWNKVGNKRVVEKVKRNTLCLDVDKGGINMISVETQQQVMLMKWLHRISIKADSNHFRLVNFFFEPVGGLKYFLSCDSHPKLFVGLDKVKSNYWKSAMIAWLKIDKSDIFSSVGTEIPIFNNPQILYKQKPIFCQIWIKKDLKYTHQMFNHNTIKTFQEVQTEIGPYGSLIFDYLIVKNALLNCHLGSSLQVVHNPDQDQRHNNFLQLSNKFLRNIITRQPNLNCIEIWKRKLNIDISNNFGIATKATKETKLRVLHFKILHNIYPSNTLLFKMGIKPSNVCEDCHEVESLDHMLFSCLKLKPFWQQINHKLGIILDQEVTLKLDQAVFGLTKTNIDANYTKINEANHLILLAKLSIVKHRFKRPSNLSFIFEYEFLLRKKCFISLINVEDHKESVARQRS